MVRLVLMISVMSLFADVSGKATSQDAPQFGPAGWYVRPMSHGYAQRLAATTDVINPKYGTNFGFAVNPPSLDGVPLWEFDSNDHKTLMGAYGCTSYDQPTAIALDLGSLDFGATSNSNQLNVLAALLHESAHADWSANYWALLATDPLYYSQLAICHGQQGGNLFGACDEEYAYSKQASGLCAAMVARVCSGVSKFSKSLDALKVRYKQAVSDCVEANTDCQARNGVCGTMPVPPDHAGCPDSTCNADCG